MRNPKATTNLASKEEAEKAAAKAARLHNDGIHGNIDYENRIAKVLSKQIPILITNLCAITGEEDLIDQRVELATRLIRENLAGISWTRAEVLARLETQFK